MRNSAPGGARCGCARCAPSPLAPPPSQHPLRPLTTLLPAGRVAPRAAGWAGDPTLHKVASEEPCPVKTTLLVMPGNLIPQWQDEIERHVDAGGRQLRGTC